MKRMRCVRRRVWNPTLRKNGEGWGTHGLVSYRKSGKGARRMSPLRPAGPIPRASRKRCRRFHAEIRFGSRNSMWLCRRCVCTAQFVSAKRCGYARPIEWVISLETYRSAEPVPHRSGSPRLAIGLRDSMSRGIELRVTTVDRGGRG